MSRTVSGFSPCRALRPAGRWAALVCALCIAATAPRAEPRDYELDPEHLAIGFLVEHIGYSKVLGQFHEVSGSYRFDEQTGELSEVSIIVETASVSTNHARRDRHLRSADFLNARRFATMTFTAATARRLDDTNYEVTGDLQLLGVTRPVTLTAVWNKSGRYPIGLRPYVMGVSARGSFRRSDFGMSYGVADGLVGDTVELIIEFEARRR